MQQLMLAHGGKLLHFPFGLPSGVGRSDYKYNWLELGTNNRYEVLAHLSPEDVKEYSYKYRPENEHLLTLADGSYIVVQTPKPYVGLDTHDGDVYPNIPGCWL